MAEPAEFHEALAAEPPAEPDPTGREDPQVCAAKVPKGGDDRVRDERVGDERVGDDHVEDGPVGDDHVEDGGGGEGEDEDGASVGAVSAAARKKPDWPAPPPDRLAGAVEAVLLVAGDVVRLERLRDLLGLVSVVPLREALDAIRVRWRDAGLAMELEEVAGGVRVVTRPEYAEYVARLARRPAADKLSRSLLETLCIVAYKQPVGRAEVERIRGVQAGDPLRGLLERRLLKVVGRSDQPGRPLLYGTTQGFLAAFGLNELKDLPSAKDLKRL